MGDGRGTFASLRLRRCRWIHHADGLAVDVAAVKATDDDAFPSWHPIVNDDLADCHPFAIEAADDAFVLGYRAGFTGGGQLPIWKHGIVASDIQRGQCWVLIDVALREGMSGGR